MLKIGVKSGKVVKNGSKRAFFVHTKIIFSVKFQFFLTNNFVHTKIKNGEFCTYKNQKMNFVHTKIG